MKFLTINKHLMIAGLCTLALAACAPTTTSMNHSGSNHGDMTMDDMTKELSGKIGDDFDKSFIEMMIVHHQGAIDMATAALQSAKHDEIKRMARDIISAQQSEIDMMKQWEKDWGYTQ